MPTNTGQNSQLLAPGLRKVFFQHLKERETQFSRIFNMITSSRAYEEDLEYIGLGTMPQKTEDRLPFTTIPCKVVRSAIRT